MRPERRGKRVVFLTYTMACPSAVGVFFRALRLGFELHRRGWSFTICNAGHVPDDPKVRQARELGEIVGLEGADADGKLRTTLELLRRIDPDLVVFGEEPFTGMEPYYRAARMLGPPFVVLEQLYNLEPVAGRWGVDLLLLYGLASMWEGRIDGSEDYEVVPPFVDDLTPADRLPLPGGLRGGPWVTVLGLDEQVLRGGIALLAGVEGERPTAVTVSSDPGMAGRLLDEAGIPRDRRAALPLLPDRDLFGLLAASRVAIVANGFMQMMEALAVGCPAICIDRGIGMDPWALDETWRPYVSLGESPERQQARLAAWLRERPFTASQLAALARERGGGAAAADRLERVALRPRLRPQCERLASRLRWLLWGQPPPAEPPPEQGDLVVEIDEPGMDGMAGYGTTAAVISRPTERP
jgi:hypothetical protein